MIWARWRRKIPKMCEACEHRHGHEVGIPFVKPALWPNQLRRSGGLRCEHNGPSSPGSLGCRSSAPNDTDGSQGTIGLARGIVVTSSGFLRWTKSESFHTSTEVAALKARAAFTMFNGCEGELNDLFSMNQRCIENRLDAMLQSVPTGSPRSLSVSDSSWC